MENQTISTMYDEISDNVFIYKLYSNPNVLESLKQVENDEIFTTLKPFCVDELQVCIFHYLSHFNT